MAIEIATQGIFVTLGSRMDAVFDQFSNGVVNSFIPSLLEIIAPCLFLYFLIKGWMIMSGRSRDAFSDLIMEVGIMSFLIAIGLSTAQTFTYAKEAFDWIQSILLSGLPMNDGGHIRNTWGWLQGLWDFMFTGFWEAGNIVWDKLGATDIGYMFLFVLLGVIGLLAAGYYMFVVTTIFIINKIVITILIAFSPVFFALGIFPVTRDFFSNWAKTALVYIFSLVLVLVVGCMFSNIFHQYIEMFSKFVLEVKRPNSGLDEIAGLMAIYAETVVSVAMMAFILGFVVKQIPALSQGLVGKFIGAGALTTTGAAVVTNVQSYNQFSNAMKQIFSVADNKDNEKNTEQEKKAQEVADQANNAGTAGLKAAAGLMAGIGAGSTATATTNGANASSGTPGNGGNSGTSSTSGFTATPISQFAQGYGGGSAQFSANGGSGPNSIPPRGASSIPPSSGSASIQTGGAGSSAPGINPTSTGMSASYSAPASVGQFTAGAQSFTTTSGPSASSTGVSGTMSSTYNPNAGSGFTLSQASQINAANLPTGPSTPVSSAQNVSVPSAVAAAGLAGAAVAGLTSGGQAQANPGQTQAVNTANSSATGTFSNFASSGQTQTNPGQAQAVNAVNSNNASPSIHAGGGTIFSTAKAQNVQAAKSPNQGGLNVTGNGYATIQPAGLSSLRQAAQNNQGLDALNRNQSTQATSPGISSNQENSNK